MTTPCRIINAVSTSPPSPSTTMIFQGCRNFTVAFDKRVAIKSSSRLSNLPSNTTSTTTSASSFNYSKRSRAASASASASAAVTSSSTTNRFESLEEWIEKIIYRCRFMAFLGTLGSLLGSVLCFIKGCIYVADSFVQYSANRGKVILLLVEAIDTYLLGTVMLVFGMGLYELFISNLNTSESISHDITSNRSSLFGMFPLKERPRWLEVTSVSELKTKVGHVIVMLLLIGLFDKSRKIVITSVADLLCISVSIFLSSACLFLLSRLNGSH